MKYHHCIILAAVLAVASVQNAVSQQVWTDKTGREIRAEFVGLSGKIVTLERKGREITLPLARLSKPSRKLAKRLAAADAPDLGPAVLAFCRTREGKRIGDGQCTALVIEALAAAGARGISGDLPGPGDYVWGQQVALIEAARQGVSGLASLSEVRPGDIIQFRDVRLEGRTGAYSTYWMEAAHHTAVVAGTDPAQATLAIYHQNWNGQNVLAGNLRLRDLKTGWLRIYRPLRAK